MGRRSNFCVSILVLGICLMVSAQNSTVTTNITTSKSVPTTQSTVTTSTTNKPSTSDKVTTTKTVSTSDAASTTSVAPQTTSTERTFSTNAASTTSVAPQTTSTERTSSTNAASTTSVAPQTSSTEAKTTKMTSTANPSTTPTSTTTSISPSSTVSPPASEADVKVKDPDTGLYCIIATLDLHFVIKYNTTKKNEVKSREIAFDRSTANNNGSCADNSMTFKWKPTNASRQWNVSFFFQQNVTSVNSLRKLLATDKAQYALTNTSLTYYLEKDVFPDVANPSSEPVNVKYNKILFSVEDQKFYQCNAKSEVNLNDNVMLDMKNAKIQAFANAKNDTFNSDDKVLCEADKSKNGSWIPLIVGIVLICLVVVVLVLYIICKKRFEKRNYEQIA